MIAKISIRLKATFLIIVFGLNTAVGFACAMGLDMGFNTSHHHDDEVTEISVHTHADGKKHEHQNAVNSHHHHEKKPNSKDDCCNDKVIKFQDLDKALNQNSKTAIDSPVIISSDVFGVNLLKAFQTVCRRYIARDFHPPPPDIRIAIQSFQI